MNPNPPPVSCQVADEGFANRVPELLAITDGIAEDLQGRYPKLRVIKDGRLQITIFRPEDFAFQQAVVSVDGVYLIEDPTGPSAQVHGPLPLEHPALFKLIYRALDQWLEKRPS